MSRLTRRSFIASVPAVAAGAARIASAAERSILSDYQAGINLGTWISQYQNQKPPQFDTRVTEKDVAQVASWGMDHVRLPVDYGFFEDPAKPGVYREERLAYIDRAIAWAKTNRLNLILDLHAAPGMFFGNRGHNTFFREPAVQQRFRDIWQMFARRYKAERENIIFELLNEVVDATPDQWNDAVDRAVAAIREIDPTRWIMVGGIDYNSVNSLPKLGVLKDPRIVYTFHFYLPMLFTHQKAHWNKDSMDYDRFTGGQQVEYPGEIPRIAEFVEKYPQYKGLRRDVGVRFDKEWMRSALAPAIEFQKNTGKSLYCGEYGVIRFASQDSRRRWYSDISSILCEHKMGRGAWCYKDGAFPFVDARTSQPIDMEQIRIAARKW